MPIAALEWLLLPPLLVGQCAIARGPAGQGSIIQPLALALWARVSPNVDARLSAPLDKPLSLQPAAWRLVERIDCVGDKTRVHVLSELVAEQALNRKVNSQNQAFSI